MRTGRGGKVAVAAASALLAVCLAGGPLYISSAASEAVQVGLSRTCLADAGLQFHLLSNVDASTGEATDAVGQELLDNLAAHLANTQVPIITDTTGAIEFHAVGDDSISPTRVILIRRDGQSAHLDGVAGTGEIGDGDVVVPVWDADVFGVGASDRIELAVDPPLVFVPDGSGGGSVGPAGGANGPTNVSLTVGSTYDDIPTRPEPSYWCAQRKLLRLKPSGDRPLPVAFVSAATMRQLSPDRTWELRPQPDGLTRDEAREMIDGFDDITAQFAAANGLQPDDFTGTNAPSQLPVLVRRAEFMAEVVARTIAPIRLGGILAAVLLLVAGGVLIAREQRRELRLRVLRGTHPATVGARVSGGALLPVAAGSAIGVTVALLAVRALGPTPEFESHAIRVALVTAGVGAVLAMLLVGGVGAIATSRSVDRRTVRHHRAVPWELALVPLAVLSYLRLDQFGGVRLVGADTKGGDLLAQAFPILALAAPLAIVARPLAALVKRSRRVAKGAPVPALMGLRRIAAEPAATTMLCIAIAFAIGAYMVSGSLTASAEQLLRDKTNTYLGGDMVVRTRSLDPIPAALRGKATPIALVSANVGGRGVDIVGIDPDTFEDAVHWRADASDSSLHDLVRSIADDSGDASGPLKAIVVGDIGDGTIITKSLAELAIDTVAEPRWFPGEHNGSSLVVVDVAALQARELPLQSFFWLTDPPADTEQVLRANGTSVLNIRESADVFEVTSFLTVRWSYAVLAAFGVLVGFAALLAQLLVLDARRQTRQATWTLTSRMGMSLRNEAAALITELGVPLAAGAIIGVGLGWIAVRIAVAPLDTIRHLQPPARAVIDLGDVATALAIGLLGLVALTLVGLLGIVRAKPIEVMRGSN